MPLNEIPIEKLYYSISEVAEMFHVNTSLIRYWEKEFDTLKPTKNKKGNRLFTRDDIEKLKVIYHLVKERGYTLQGARESMKQMKGAAAEPNIKQDLLKSLEKVKAELESLKEKL
jgi:DNA-binding transcriptional MerR regulator